MIQTFIKNSITRYFRVENGKVYTTIILGDFNITNPTLEQFLSTGWTEYTPPESESYIPTLEELVEQKIRERYSLNQEFEVQRKRFKEPEAFEKYNNFVEECISSAKQELNLQ